MSQKEMIKAYYGYEFDSQEKVDEFNSGANVCFSGCKDINDPPDEACKTCKINKECMSCCEDYD